MCGVFMKKRLIGLALSTALLCGSANAADRVVFGLDFVPSGQHTPFYVALKKGFFEANGLDIDLQRGYGSSDSVKRVASGAFEVGFGDAGTVVLSRGEGLKIKLFAMIYAVSPYALVLRDDADIKSAKDLAGKTLVGPVGSASRVMFPLLAKKVGIDPASVTWLTTDGASLLPALIANRASGMTAYTVGSATYLAKGAENGVKLSMLKFSDYGVNVYSNGLIARDETIAKKPDVLRRIVKSLSEAFAYTYAHPGEAAEIMVTAQPQLSRELTELDIVDVREANPVPGDGHPWGYMSRDVMKKTQEAAAEAYASSTAAAVNIDDCFTNDLLK
jgi:NitT/TauT family transport system substrate-binding protein